MAKDDDVEEKRKMSQPATATSPDPVPPLHVLEAAYEQDRKETEDLLAGFDRPGRGPQKPEARERDFVEYFTKKKSDPKVEASGSAPARSAAPPAKARQVDISTVVVPKKRGSSGLVWIGAGAAMLALGGMVAWLATREEARTTSPGAATTITNASPPPTTRTSAEDIPPPTAASEVATAMTTTATATATSVPDTSARGPRKREPRAGASTAPSSTPMTTIPAATTPSTKPPPRDDLFRDM